MKYAGLALLGAISYGIGLMRFHYILNFTRSDFPFLLSRKLADELHYPLVWSDLFSSLIRDPRWLSALVYGILPIVLVMLGARIWLGHWRFNRLIVWSYMAVGLLALCFSVITWVGAPARYGLAIALHLKRMMMEPWLGVVVLAAVIWMQRQDKSH
jgi:hypothetical protein